MPRIGFGTDDPDVPLEIIMPRKKKRKKRGTSTNKQSTAIAQIAADIEEWGNHPGRNAVRVDPCVFRKWARQLRAL